MIHVWSINNLYSLSLSLFIFKAMFVKSSNCMWWPFHPRGPRHSHALSSSGGRAVLAQDGVWVMKEGKAASAISFLLLKIEAKNLSCI